MQKHCGKCGETKDIGEFYKNKTAKDGHQNYCKPCWKKDCADRKLRNPDRRRQISRDSARRAAAERAEGIRPKLVYRRKPYDIKEQARRRLQDRVARGVIIRQPCMFCGEPNGDAHHEDYTRPLDVHWVCRLCHAKVHRAEVAGIIH